MRKSRKTYSHTGIGLGYVDHGGIKLFLLIISIADNSARKSDADQHNSCRPHLLCRDFFQPRGCFLKLFP